MRTTHIIPSLQGTLAKHTTPTLKSNFAKEPFRPSRSNAGLKESATVIDKQIENINRQCLTGCHKTFWGRWLFEHSATHQLLVSGDKNAVRSPKRFIQPNRWQQGKTTCYNEN
jgi:hypothetical protein